MDTLLHAISGVLTLILMGLIGCVLAELGWINDTNKSILPKLINYVSLPLFFVYNITHTFSHDQLLHLIKGSIVPFISIAICFILSVIAAHFMAPKGRRGIFQSSFTTSNVIFVGLPVTMALFGDYLVKKLYRIHFYTSLLIRHFSGLWAMLVFNQTQQIFLIKKFSLYPL